MDDIERTTTRKVMRRLVPFLCLCYFIAYLDRVNVGFAALQMNAALGLDAGMFGFGAGLFFIAYFLLEVPSNMALNRFGARKWIARIMVTWGVISAAFAFIPQISHATGLSTEYTFYVLRFLLGMAEAGFFPGVIFYITLWFPSVYRARIVSLFMLAIPFSSIVGAPLSGALLSVSGFGLDGWQWLFLFEGVPACIIAIFVLFYLPDRPQDATWLRPEEHAWLESRLAGERQLKEATAGHFSFLRSIADPRILTLALVYFCLNGGSYGVSYFLPTIVKGFGLSNFMTGVVSALPFVFGAVGMVVLSRHIGQDDGAARPCRGRARHGGGGDRPLGFCRQPGAEDGAVVLRADRCLIGAADVLADPVELPHRRLGGGRHRGDQFARQFVGVWRAVPDGLAEKRTGDFTAGLVCLAIAAAIGAVAVLLLRVNPALERAPQPQPQPSQASA
jgi:MFS transporter, ACS family, tartrate transporter